MILISSCLLGLKTRYDGEDNAHSLLMKYIHLGQYVPVCPEQLGGLSTPRLPAEITDGSGEDVLMGKRTVINIEGRDVTAEFIKGANDAKQIVNSFPITSAILKERSPSCGVHQIYNGEFNATLKKGKGVTAALLKEHHIPVHSEEELTDELLKKLLGLS